MIIIPQPLFNIRKIKDFNITLDRQINNQMWPPVEGRLQMRLIALFNKYLIGRLEIYQFTNLWTRLIGL